MRDQLFRVVEQLSNIADPAVFSKFKKRLNQNTGLTRETNLKDHFGTFIAPIYKNSHVFLVHHKKANSWIPPGGHLDEGESPLDTVAREIREELNYNAKPTDFTLLDLSITDIDNNTPCKRHWDIWYGISTPQIEFDIDPNEFFAGKWLPLKQAINDYDEKLHIPSFEKLSRI